MVCGEQTLPQEHRGYIEEVEIVLELNQHSEESHTDYREYAHDQIHSTVQEQINV